MLAPSAHAADAKAPTGLWKQWSELTLKPDQVAYIFGIHPSFETPMVWLVICDAQQTTVTVERLTWDKKNPVDFQHTWHMDYDNRDFEKNRIAELAKKPTSDQTGLDGTTYTIRTREGGQPDKEYSGRLHCDPDHPSKEDCKEPREALYAWLVKVTGIIPRTFFSKEEAGRDDEEMNRPDK